MKPITRKEFYLAKAAGLYSGPTPAPVLHEDYYLATLAGDYAGYCPPPVIRIQKYMSVAAGVYNTALPKPITREEMYWYAIATKTGFLPEPATRYEKFLYTIAIKAPEPEYVDKTAQGNPLLLNSAAAPFTSLTLYGWSKQDGTPSPDDPVPIVSAGSVMTTGAQLFKNYSVKIPVTPSTTYYVSSGQRTEPGRIDIGCYDSNQQLINADGLIDIPVNIYLQSNGLYRLSGDSDSLSFKITTGENTSFLAFIIPSFQIDGFPSLMLNAGDTPLTWEPYTGGQPAANPYEGEINVTVSDGGEQSQTLTVSTPGGLPGIPVTVSKLPEGVEPTYVDDSGQAWICDEVDFERGVYVRRVWKHTFDGSENWGLYIPGSGGYNAFRLLDALIEPSDKRDGLSNQFEINTVMESGDTFLWIGSLDTRIIYAINTPFYDSSLEDFGLSNWKAHLAAHPLEVMTYLTTATEEPLTAEEIAAYKALRTYSPTTTMSNDAKAWMEVGYKAPAE